jgi:hypothetical protein
MALTTGITEKTLRKWVGVVVKFFAESIDNWVRATPKQVLLRVQRLLVKHPILTLHCGLQIHWDNRLMSDNGSACKVTVDGTDFRIMEPIPFDSKWLSEKFNEPGVKYEVAVCIQTGWIVHTNGTVA